MSDFSLERLERLVTWPGVTLRHDVDYNPDCALRMAKFERYFGVRSTYYIRCEADEYNLFSRTTQDTLLEIVSLGHELGMHLNLGLPRDTEVDTDWLHQMVFDLEEAFLASQVPFTDKISFHAPPHSVMGLSVEPWIAANGPEWNGRYLADSRGVWRETPEQFLSRAPNAQLGLHPEWYFLPADEAQALREREALKP